MSTPRLSPTSFVVLGLLERHGPATPYDLKQYAQISVFKFWSVPHTQLYTECARLAEAGLLREQREESGRRRRLFSLTDDGRRAFDAWRSTPAEVTYELRDPGLLKLSFGGDPAALAASQVAAHERQLASYEELLDKFGEVMPRGMRLALEGGVGHEREFVRFWSGLLAE